MLNRRIVIPEILDRLDPADPEAIRSRKDLRTINSLMRNEQWIVQQVAKHPDIARKGIVEIGAGEGKLLRKLERFGPATGLDIAPRPDSLPSTINWQRQDLFQAIEEGSLNPAGGGILVACLFLHHFEDSQLAQLATFVSHFDILCIVEPLRRPLSLLCSTVMLPFVNRVTRHDMPVSIRAGFDVEELPKVIGLTQGDWEIDEVPSRRGGLRVAAVHALNSRLGGYR